MTPDGEKVAPRVEIHRALASEQPLIANLLELYIHDFSEFVEVDLGEDGRFGYPALPLYWSEPGRHPFLIRCDGKLAGFALVKRGSDFSGSSEVWDMAEFCLLRGHRHRGVGATAAHQLWKMFCGSWEVRVMQSNIGARQFWARASEGFMQKPIAPLLIERHGMAWELFSFESMGSDGSEVPSR